MKAKVFKGISLAVICLAVISCFVLAGTMAKYLTTNTGTDDVTVAKWSFTVNDDDITTEDAFTLALVPTNYNEVTEGMIAPGTMGSFTIESKNLSNVDATYTISFTATGTPTNLKFYYATPTHDADSGNFTGTELKDDADGTADGTYTYNFTTANDSAVDGKLAIDAAAETVVIYWAWDYATANGDDADTTNGIAGGETGTKMSVTVTLTATQDKPTVKS